MGAATHSTSDARNSFSLGSSGCLVSHRKVTTKTRQKQILFRKILYPHSVAGIIDTERPPS